MEKEREVIALLARLVRIRSYSGHEEGIVDALSAYAREHGFDKVTIDPYGNVIMTITGDYPGPKLLFDGHMDTVPVNEADQWKHDPLGAEIEDGKMYGRGTSDMKGALAAMMTGAASFLEERGHHFAGEINVSGVVHEECFEGVAARSISQMVNPDIVIIGEASELNLKIAQRGRAEVVLETFGVPAHSSNPEKGLNAVYMMTEAIQAIRKLKPPVHPFMGKGIMELTDIKSEPYPGASVVPEYCKATFDRRLLVGETEESVLAPVKGVLTDLKKKDGRFQARVSFAKGSERCYTGKTIQGKRFFPGWLFNEKADYIQKICREMRKSGHTPILTRYDFCTNGSHYAGEAGIKTVGLGPSRENLAHTMDEYIELSQLTGAVECYLDVMHALL
ncbi:MAG: YgeY family selenium metabolism-linked hydrolase [Clostridiales bacterium]|nr:YgeY family selenium metabolism-linked hydrolase [Clostridiales bacterium]